ncbi:MAG: porphobilinogen synthase [Aigarchaeota archaeon]|nr:porphobilinogen synthase [Aigarchaeota archaeon]MCX8192525.1 porphobilinogen synthase [Nitrososphaeria archaeon]MDW7985739.1 porphobilinogen synthase [Nitrososphaerota archaeon]
MVQLNRYGFPPIRLRRLRKNKIIRDLVAEERISPDSLVMPLFVKERLSGREPVNGMPNQERLSIEELLKEVGELLNLNIRTILLFGIPSRKDSIGSSAYDRDGIVQRAVREVKKNFGEDVVLITDVCLCQYTSHGHCGIISTKNNVTVVDNDSTVEVLTKVALSHAEAGADIVAPSDMMDGRVSAIRSALDSAGYTDVAIMAYSAKYASSLYGPFRNATSSTPAFGDRRSYQIDPRNVREAIREVELDVFEGADIIMVKPATWYLDVISIVKNTFDVPVAAYSVSGEYTMIKLMVEKGLIDEKQAVWEQLNCIKRAGADIIITYFAKDYARWLRDGVIP